jgi:hypothetical protein
MSTGPFPTRHVHHRRWSPGLIRRVLRRPAAYWALAAVLAIATGVSVNHVTTDAQRLRDAYGVTVPVVVLVQSVAPGALIAPHAQILDRPASLVPDGALANLDASPVAAGPMTSGTMVTEVNVARPGAVTSGEAALAVPRVPTTPPVGIGTTVIFIVNADPLVGLESQLIEGRVADVTEDQVLVSVARSDLAAASAALSTGTATLALAG